MSVWNTFICGASYSNIGLFNLIEKSHFTLLSHDCTDLFIKLLYVLCIICKTKFIKIECFSPTWASVDLDLNIITINKISFFPATFNKLKIRYCSNKEKENKQKCSIITNWFDYYFKLTWELLYRSIFMWLTLWNFGCL